MAAEKKHTDVYNSYKVYMELGRYLAKRHQDDKALNYYSYAQEVTKMQAQLGKVFVERAKMNGALGNLSEAREDIDNGIKLLPEDLQGLCTDAYICFQEDKYEESLVKNIQGSFHRKFPNYFTEGVKIANGTIEDTIGYNAGNFTSLSVLGPSIVQAKLAAMNFLPEPLLISEFERKRKMELYKLKKRCISEKYLGPVAKEKNFMFECLNSSTLSFQVSSKNDSLKDCLQNGLERIKCKEESLWRRKPLYVYSNLAAKPSQKFREERKSSTKFKARLLQQEFERQLSCIREAMLRNDWSWCFTMAEKLRGKLFPISRKHIPQKGDYLREIYLIVGQMYLSMKTFIKRWNTKKNDNRILYMLGAQLPYGLEMELYRDSVHSKIVDDKEFLKKMMYCLKGSTNSLESIYFSFELACCFSLNNQTELMRNSARHCLFESKKIGNITWYVNCIFLLARKAVQDNNVIDAVMTLVAAKNACEEFGMREQAAFAKRALFLLGEEKQRTTEKVEGPIKNREEAVVRLMPDNDLKCRATTLIQKMNTLPPQFRMSIIPGLKPGKAKKIIKQKEIEKDAAIVKEVVADQLSKEEALHIIPDELLYL